jgi:hypothetical protein
VLLKRLVGISRHPLDVFLESGVDDPAQETAAKAVSDMDALIDDAVGRVISYSYRTSEVIETSNQEIVRSARASAVTLAPGARPGRPQPASRR